MNAAAAAMLKGAAIDGSVEQIRQLLRSGADPDATDERGRTALHWAAERGQANAVRELVQSMAQTDVQETDGRTPLHLASWNDHGPVVELLVEAQADANVKRSYGATALHIAAENGYENVVRLLLKAGADCDRLRDDFISPVQLAAQSGHAELLREMLETGDPNLPDNRGVTPLHIAAHCGHARVISALVHAGADPNSSGYTEIDNATPLHLAASMGHGGVVRQLLQEGCDPSVRTAAGLSAATSACAFGHSNILVLLLRYSPESIQLPECCATDAVRRLMGMLASRDPGEPKERLSTEPALPSCDEAALSQELHRTLCNSGFVRSRARLQTALAEVMQTILRRRLTSGEFADHDLHYVGSFPEGWASSLVQLNGRTDPDSDTDVSSIGRSRVFHFKGLCSCDDKGPGLLEADYENGHIRWSGTASNPAQSWLGFGSKPAVDLVWAFRCCCYPPIEVLKQKYRTCIAPAVLQDLRSVLQNFPCHLVSAAPPGEDGQQLRVSTTFLEKKLLQSLNDVQGHVFILMKYIVKKVISEEVDGLKTYHAKSLTFYLLDETPEGMWQPSQLLHLARLGLQKLLACLQDTSNPDQCMKHFFMRDAWLYLKKGHSGKETIMKVVRDVINRLPGLLLQFKSSLRPLTDEEPFQFHPFLAMPVLQPSQVTDWNNLQFHEVYDAVRILLLKLANEKCSPELRQTLLSDASRLPDSARTARESLLALTYLKFGEEDEARQILIRSEGHRASRGVSPCPADTPAADFVWQQLEGTDSAWKFCFESDKPLTLDFLPESSGLQFPVGAIYIDWFYLNFEALLRCLSLKLNVASEVTARTWFKETLQKCDNPDVQELMTVLEFCRDKDLLVQLVHVHKEMICNWPELSRRVRKLVKEDPLLVQLSVERTVSAAIDEERTGASCETERN